MLSIPELSGSDTDVKLNEQIANFAGQIKHATKILVTAISGELFHLWMDKTPDSYGWIQITAILSSKWIPAVCPNTAMLLCLWKYGLNGWHMLIL